MPVELHHAVEQLDQLRTHLLPAEEVVHGRCVKARYTRGGQLGDALRVRPAAAFAVGAQSLLKFS